MATRGQNVLSLSHLSVALLGAALLLLNAAAVRASARLDLTEDKLWTLSDGTKEVLAALKDPATIKVFWKDVPQLGDTEGDRRYLASLLDEMRGAANGLLTVRWVDLEDKDGQKEAEDLHVQEFPVRSMTEGELRIVNSYQTLVIEHGAAEPDRLEPLMQGRASYEYEIASRLHKMTRGTMPGVGLVAPRPSFDPMMGMGGHGGGRFSYLSEALRQQFGSSARTWMSLDEPVPEDVKILFVVAPESLEAKQVFHLDQFALRGGKVVLLLDPFNLTALQQSHGMGSAVSSGLEDWLAHLGITVEKAVVAEFARDAMMSFPREQETRIGRMLTYVPFNYWPSAREPFLDQTTPAMRGMDEIPFFWPAPIVVDAEKTTAAGRKATALVKTSPYSWRQTETSGLLERPRVPPEDQMVSYNLAVLLEGPAESAWKGKKSPTEEEKAKKDEEEKKRKEEEAKKAAPEKPGEKPAAEAPKDESATPEEPKAEDAKPEEPKAEEPKPEEPKAEEPKPEEPKAEEPKAEEPKPEEPEADEKAGEKTEEKGPKRENEGRVTILVVGDAELVADVPAAQWGRQLPGYDRGFAWMSNVLDWMSGSEALLQLRARTEKPRAVETLEPSTQSLLKWVNIAAVPLLLLLVGIVVFIVRKFGR